MPNIADMGGICTLIEVNRNINGNSLLEGKIRKWDYKV